MQITVKRAPADNQGPNIIDHLLTSDVVGVARCRGEIDYHSTDRDEPNCNCPKHDFIETGTIARVGDRYGLWAGMVRWCQLTVTISGDHYAANMSLNIEREV
ncbi:hypothetical protein [Desulforhopalus singaporensis]|uniref:Uncharacterized protein n=1 Tax=Desulforhopalus singaporensis TaxID=91360 RepID=A0A1H0UUH9_9BACT|nr:hypothetical protein [Desulforhopalus singaporensis]SDP69887.1 hypothetical protein SAMN05660330_03731 [Desulforhopalus singaporensis]